MEIKLRLGVYFPFLGWLVEMPARPSKKKVFGHGIKGDACTVGINGKRLKSYNVWKRMLERCYSPRVHARFPDYAVMSVCEEWLDFGTFRDWFDMNHREGFQIEIPKDKVYAPETCTFVTRKGTAQRSRKKVYGHGIKGDGIGWKDGKSTPAYQTWHGMLGRCYSPAFRARCPAYDECIVCEEWKYLDTFHEWFETHYREGFQLDKDILVPGNKIYSPETCAFVPQEINVLLTDSRRSRGLYPRGVVFDQNRFRADCSRHGKQRYLGHYDTPEEASRVYRAYKHKHIAKMANRYYSLGAITQEVCDALHCYKVDD